MGKKDNNNFGVSPEEVDDELSMLDDTSTATLSKEMKIGVGVILLLLVVLSVVLVKRFFRSAPPTEPAVAATDAQTPPAGDANTPPATGQPFGAVSPDTAKTLDATTPPTGSSAFPIGDPPTASASSGSGAGYSMPPFQMPASPSGSSSTEIGSAASNGVVPSGPFSQPPAPTSPNSSDAAAAPPDPTTGALTLPKPPEPAMTPTASEPPPAFGVADSANAAPMGSGQYNNPAPSPSGHYGGNGSRSPMPGHDGFHIGNNSGLADSGRSAYGSPQGRGTSDSGYGGNSLRNGSSGRHHGDELQPRLSPPPGFGAAPGTAERHPGTTSPEGTHRVEPNESFASISKLVYGTEGYYQALAAHNRKQVLDPNNLQPGTILATPSAEELRAKYPAACPSAAHIAADEERARTARPSRQYGGGGGRNYTVQAGDTLFDIAKYKLGKASRWAEIYELNRDTLGQNINYLKPGMTLLLPPDGGSSSGAAPAPQLNSFR